MRRLLLYLSKTDLDILESCPKSTMHQQTALGAFVLFTGILAFFSASFAASNLFLEIQDEGQMPTVTEQGRYIASFIGLLYACIIMAIDREIVSATSKWAVVFRAPLALIIGVVIAVPLELKLLEPNIIEELGNQEFEEVEMRKKRLITDIERNYQRIDDQLRIEIKELKTRESRYDSLIQAEKVGIVREGSTGIGGTGPAYDEAVRLRNKTQSSADSLNSIRDSVLSVAAEKVQDGVKTFESYPVSKSYDLLSKYRTLNTLQDKDAAVRNMSWGITLLLIFIELIPSLMKLLSNQSEYDALLEARRRLNIQFAYRATNLEMQALEDVSDDEVRSDDFKKKIIRAFASIKETIMR